MLTETELNKSSEIIHLPQSRLPEQWTQEESINYEVARECIGGMIAIRSKWIYNEEKKLSPDHEAIARWDAEIDAYEKERRSLNLHDHENIERVSNTYGTEIKRLHAIEANHRQLRAG